MCRCRSFWYMYNLHHICIFLYTWHTNNANRDKPFVNNLTLNCNCKLSIDHWDGVSKTFPIIYFLAIWFVYIYLVQDDWQLAQNSPVVRSRWHASCAISWKWCLDTRVQANPPSNQFDVVGGLLYLYAGALRGGVMVSQNGCWAAVFTMWAAPSLHKISLRELLTSSFFWAVMLWLYLSQIKFCRS